MQRTIYWILIVSHDHIGEDLPLLRFVLYHFLSWRINEPIASMQDTMIDSFGTTSGELL